MTQNKYFSLLTHTKKLLFLIQLQELESGWTYRRESWNGYLDLNIHKFWKIKVEDPLCCNVTKASQVTKQDGKQVLKMNNQDFVTSFHNFYNPAYMILKWKKEFQWIYPWKSYWNFSQQFDIHQNCNYHSIFVTFGPKEKTRYQITLI